MNEWVSEWLSDWVNEQTNEYVSKQESLYNNEHETCEHSHVCQCIEKNTHFFTLMKLDIQI